MLKLHENTSDREKDNALAEIRYLASVQHPNVICYKAAFIDEPTSSLCLVMEYANSGDLGQRIKYLRENNQMFQEDVILKITVQMCQGIKALHSLRVMHRDIKVNFRVLTTYVERKHFSNRRQYRESW